jgi:hypothetical protein
MSDRGIVLVLSQDELLRLYMQLPYLHGLNITRRMLLEKIQTHNHYLGHDAASRYKLFLQRQSDAGQH